MQIDTILLVVLLAMFFAVAFRLGRKWERDFGEGTLYVSHGPTLRAPDAGGQTCPSCGGAGYLRYQDTSAPHMETSKWIKVDAFIDPELDEIMISFSGPIGGVIYSLTDNLDAMLDIGTGEVMGFAVQGFLEGSKATQQPRAADGTRDWPCLEFPAEPNRRCTAEYCRPRSG